LDDLEKLLSLSHDPMLALENGVVIAMNDAAGTQLPGFQIGKRLNDTVPEYILQDRSDCFTATLTLRSREFIVSCAHVDRFLVLCMHPVNSRSRGLLTEGLFGGMKSALFNVGLTSREIGLDESLAPKSREYLSMLRHNYYILNRQLSNLSFAVALQERTAFLNLEQIDLVRLCDDLVRAVSSVSGPELASVEFQTALPSLPVSVDREKIERLLLNLLSNSFAGCRPDGHIQVILSVQGDDAVITVKDDGSDISTKTLQSVFSQFDKLIDGEDLDHSYSGGFGLGIVRGIVQMHGGALVIDSEPGSGASVRVLLPLKQAGTLRDPGVPWKEDNLVALLLELSDVLDHRSYLGEFE